MITRFSSDNNATYELTVHVTQADIDHGKRASYSACPIALAVKRQLDCYAHVTRDYVLLDFFKDKKCHTIRMRNSDDAENFIRTYDGGSAVYPCTLSFFFSLAY